VPSRNRTIRPSASCLRYIRKISLLWWFSNLRKLSTIHPLVAYALRKQVFTNLITEPANSQPTVRRSDLALLSWLLTIRNLVSQKSASGKLHSLVQIVGYSYIGPKRRYRT
jgi:hypothetical protein